MDSIKSFKKFIKESIWSDMQDRSAGDVVRKEDDVNNLDLNELYEYIKDQYKAKVEYIDLDVIDENGDVLGVDITEDIILFYKPKRGHIMLSWVKKPIPFLNELEDRFNIENPNSIRRIITEKDGSCTNKTFIDAIEFFLKHKESMMNESIWSDMQDRSAGKTVRKEDERHKILERLLATYIKLFAESCYYHDEYTYYSYPDFRSYIKDFRDNPRIEEVCPNNSCIDDLLDYVNKETWDNQIFDTIVEISHRIDKGEHPITDDVIEELSKHNVNESIWSDMQDRSAGDVVRKEDEMTQDVFDAVDDFIFGFATRVVWDGMKYSLTNFLKYIDENSESLDCDIKRVKKYVEDNWYKGICDDVEAAIEREEKERDQVMYESIWSDMQDRSVGDVIRKEDEMNDDDFLMLRETAKMFRNSYASRRNTCDNFIKYIERRKEEHFWTSVSDEVYDKVIRFVQKNWGDCTGIQEFMDKYLSNINECDGVPGGLTPADVGGMGPAYFPGLNGEPGSGDLPSPTGIVYKQVAPFDSFIKMRKQKRKKKKFRKEDEPCVHSENPPIYSHVDDFRDYVDRTYDNIDKKK